MKSLIDFMCTERGEVQLYPCCSHCSSSKQKCQMPGHYPFCWNCNINRRARGTMRHRDFGKVTLTSWRPAKAGGQYIYLLRWRLCSSPGGRLPKPSAQLLLLPLNTHTHTHTLPSSVRHPTAATDTLLFCCTPRG